MERELKALLIAATFERNRLTRRIAGASESERKLRRLVAPFARASNTVAELPPGAADALSRARRLRDDIAARETGVKEAAEVIRVCRGFQALLQEARADLQRTLDSLERRFRAAETKSALARLANRLGIMERTVRDDLTTHTEEIEAWGDTAYRQPWTRRS
ncbi:hypothetical protein ABZZ74_51465 [Streptomyces sp. NPDC006476]|uniref:hypothetical protein n=1 Tax=Streptomyces sp. NPDC006476 TaxID=3157175 RepID=UPI0033B998A9